MHVWWLVDRPPGVEWRYIYYDLAHAEGVLYDV
jgi:hypothetical protein